MREILFRGKDFGGFWHHGFLGGVTEDCAEILEEFSGSKICALVSKETVGQFTGVSDKNGARIFEGDIISIEGHYLSAFHVVFSKSSWRAESQNNFSLYEEKLVESKKDKYKIIGNIYENSMKG